MASPAPQCPAGSLAADAALPAPIFLSPPVALPNIAVAPRRSPSGLKPIQVRPTGFSGVPPPGPAMPLTEMPISAASALRTPHAISITVSLADRAVLSPACASARPTGDTLAVVGVGDHTAQVIVDEPGIVGQAVADQPARTRFGRCQPQTAPAQQLANSDFEGLWESCANYTSVNALGIAIPSPGFSASHYQILPWSVLKFSAMKILEHLERILNSLPTKPGCY